MGPAVERVHPLDGGQRLVDTVEVAGEHQAAVRLQLGRFGVDAQRGGGGRGAAGAVDDEHRHLLGQEGPQPPAVAVFALDLFEHLPAGLIGVYMPRGGQASGDPRGERAYQRRHGLQSPGDAPGRHVGAFGLQHRADPVDRQPEHVLVEQQPRQERRGEQPFGHHLWRGRGAHRRRPGTRAAALVAATPPNDPDNLDPPVQLPGVLAAGRNERLAARGAAPLIRLHIDEAVLGVQMGVIPPAMARRAPALSPLRLARPALPVAGLPIASPVITSTVAGSPLLRRGAKQDPRECGDLLGQQRHLLRQLHHPRVQLGLIGNQRRHMRLSPLSPGTPITDIGLYAGLGLGCGGHPTKVTPSKAGSHAPHPRRVAEPKITTGSPNTYR